LAPLPDQYGETSITIEATDGANPAVSQAFSIKILPVNDPPTLHISKSTFDVYPGEAVEIAGWAAFSPGPNEDQLVDHYALSPSNPSFFLEPPAVNNSGDLSFITSSSVVGQTVFEVRVIDDGGTDNGGENTSPPQQIVVNVLANEAPEITISGLSQVFVGEAYEYVVSASDPDGNINFFEIVKKPSWLSESASSLSEVKLTGSPSSGDKAIENVIEARVVDLALVETVESFHIEVIEKVDIGFENLNRVYDGAAIQPTIITNPIVTGIEVTYNGSPALPVNAGTYLVKVVVVEPGFSGEDSAVFVIEKAEAAVTMGNLNHTYDGTPKTAAVTVTPDISVEVAYNGSAEAPSLVGSYLVEAEVVDPNYSGFASGTLVISEALVNIEIGDTSFVYDGEPKSVTVILDREVDFEITYNGSPDAPANAGTYEVKATVVEPGYRGGASAIMTIEKAEAEIALNRLVQTYGDVVPVTATTDPPGLAVSILYDGEANIPEEAGDYPVYAAIDDPNYEGSVSGTLTILPREAAITISGLLQNYDGAPKSVNVVTDPAGLDVKIVFNNSENPPAAPGSYEVEASVIDPNYTGTKTATLIINGPPVIVSPIPSINVEEDANEAIVDLNHYFNDSENGSTPLVYDVSSISNENLVEVSIQPDGKAIIKFIANAYGNAAITIRATDANGLSVETLFIVNVAFVNDAPEFISDPVVEALQGVEYRYEIKVADPDDNADELQIIAEDIPKWLSLQAGENGSAILSGIPGNEDVGEHLVMLAVADGSARVTQSFAISVANINDPPYFESQPPTSAIRNQLYTYDIVVKDLDEGDSRLISVIKKPSWLTFQSLGEGLARLSGTPRQNHIDMDNGVILQATDGNGLSTLQQFTIAIIAINEPPLFTSVPIEGILEGELYNYQITASDPDPSDMLMFTAIVKPSWLTLADNGDRTAVLSGTADDPDVGVNQVVLAVRDPAGVTVLQEFSISVANVNEPPVFTSVPFTKAIEKTPYKYTVTTQDPDAGDSWIVESVVKPSWLTFALIGKGVYELSGLPSSSDTGSFEVRLIARDNHGLESEQRFYIEVENVNDAPQFISMPVVQAVVNEHYQYEAQAADDDEHDNLVIEGIVLPAWLSLKPNGRSASLSGEPVQSGVFTVRLKVSDDSGAQALQEFTIHVNARPSVSDFPKNVYEDSTLFFAGADFTGSFSDPDANPLDAIRIETVPANGKLTINSKVVNEGEQIPLASLGLLRYAPDPNFSGDDEFRWRGFDGYSYSHNEAVVSIAVEPVNDPPELLNIETAPLTFTPNKDAPKPITETLRIVDVDNENLAGAQVIFNSRSYRMDEDELVFENVGQIEGVFNVEAGALTFHGVDTKENYEKVLRSVKYNNTAVYPSFGVIRTVNIYVDDGQESSAFMKRDIALENGLVELSIPSAFTPNGDDVNNSWIIRNINLYPDCEVSVFGKTGNLVFHSKGYNQPWDGTYKGSALPAGSYYYIIRLNEFNKVYNGSITIIR